jgi:glycosyltransferase involved in cell wall biosynthesis
MKALFVSNISWSLYNFRRGLMAEIKNRGHEVVFCAARDEYTLKLQESGFRYVPISLDRKGTNILKDTCLFFSLIKIYYKEKPDWIFHNSTKPFLYGAIAAYLTGRRCINTHSGLGYLFINMGFLTRFLLVFYRIAGFCATKTFFQNKDDVQLFLSKRLIEAEKCVLVGGSGVNTDFFKPDKEKDDGSSEEGFTFLFLGRILWDKGIGELIESVRIVKKTYPLLKVNFLGMIDNGNPAGISRSQVERWEEEGLIKYLGETVCVKPYLENCDCVILPSYREGMPRALLEAASMELPVITTDVPGCRFAVENGVTGLLVKVRDPIDLARAMKEMIEMPKSQRRKMGEEGRAKVIREYSERAVIGAYCEQAGL